MRLADFIAASADRIAAEWERFAHDRVPAAGAMNLDERRDHIGGMLRAITRDLAQPQTKRAGVTKAQGASDAAPTAQNAATAHGVDRASSGFTPSQMVSEFRALRASVMRLWIEAHGPPTATDFVDVDRFHQAVDQALAESLVKFAAYMERSTDLLLGVIGHDLRNPLGVVMLTATTMQAQAETTWAHHAPVARILRSGERMERLLADLLDVTRTRLGSGIPLVLADTDMAQLARLATDELAALHPRCAVHLDVGAPLPGRWDGGRISQALSNLLANACHHGGAEGPVTVVVRGGPTEVTVSIHNLGPVVPPTLLARIFDPLRQVDPDRTRARNPSSIGLGLYIVHAIVAAHAGTVDVTSTEAGTTFTMRLPTGAVPA